MSALFPPTPAWLAGVTARPPRRLGEVVAVADLTPSLRRVVFAGAQLRDFASAAPDDHVKLLFTDTDGTPAPRSYTPRHFDRARGELSIDFVIHHQPGHQPGHEPGHAPGPALRWAMQASPGQTLGIAGPKASRAVPRARHWLLIGDETAIPAIARRLEELEDGDGVAATVLIELDDRRHEPVLRDAPWIRVMWRTRQGRPAGTTQVLEQAVESLAFDSDGLQVWLAAEIEIARRLRTHLLAERGVPAAQLRAAGYWRRGVANAHTSFRD